LTPRRATRGRRGPRQRRDPLTGDKRLKREGKADQAVGRIKQKVEKVIGNVKDALGRVAV
jgi:hypothetical protein